MSLSVAWDVGVNHSWRFFQRGYVGGTRKARYWILEFEGMGGDVREGRKRGGREGRKERKKA